MEICSCFINWNSSSDYAKSQSESGAMEYWHIQINALRHWKQYESLTRFNDYEAGKASNPVASTDGKYMAFQFANTTDPAGVGYGLLLYKF